MAFSPQSKTALLSKSAALAVALLLIAGCAQKMGTGASSDAKPAMTKVAADLVPLMHHPRVIGLAEFMNYPGVLYKDPGCMAKLQAFEGRHIDGHAPLLRGNDLNGYIAAGIRTEHEATTAAEAIEKLQKGMRVLIREGSVSKDLDALAPVLTPLTFATDIWTSLRYAIRLFRKSSTSPDTLFRIS